MSSGWIITTTNEKYGVAVYNFEKNGTQYLSLSVGDSVHILEKFKDDWYRGCLLGDETKKGVFPKSYIYVKPAIIDDIGTKAEAVTPDEPAIVLEMTHVVREWGRLWKKIYTKNEDKNKFLKLRPMLHSMINTRRRIVSGTLPADELVQLKREVCDIIDTGNKLLGLDMTIRDEDYNAINVQDISAVELYEKYDSSSQRIQRSIAEQELRDNGRMMTTEYIPDSTSTTHVHSFYVTVKNFVCRIGEDADVFMALYDAKTNTFISENYIVRWGSQGLPKRIDMLNNLKALFTDLGSKDLQKEKIYLVCQIVRIGRMELKESDSKRMTIGLRRPFGISVMNVTGIIKETEETDEDKQHFIPFIQISGENENLQQLVQRTIASRSELNHKGQGLWLSMKMLHGDVKSVRNEYQHLVDKSTAVIRKMGFPEVIMPGDIRNDLYVTLIQGEFERGSKTAQKNTEVTMCVCDKNGITIPIVVRMGEGEDPMNDYRSCIYYQNKAPKWNEIVKVRVPIEDFYHAHLRFTFRHRSTMEHKDKNEKDYAMAFVKLMQKNGTTLPDGNHNLVVYKLESRKLELAKYLTLPSTREELEAQPVNKGKTGQNQKYSIPRVEGFVLSRDNFQISTLVCSTKLTQNVDLLGLLKWKGNEKELEKNLDSLMKVDGEEIVKFLQDTLDALFNILMDNLADGKYDTKVFHALVHIIGLIAEKKFFHFYAVLDTYIKEHFSATLAYEKLTKVLIQFLQKGSNSNFKDPLVKTLKAFEYVFKFIVQSRLLFQKLNADSGRAAFEKQIHDVFKSLNQLMVSKDNQLIIIQGHAMKYTPSVIEDIILVYSEMSLSNLLKEFVQNVPADWLTKQKIQCMLDIVHSTIFKIPDCRKVLLEMMTETLQSLMDRGEELDSCVRLLSDILKSLRCTDASCTSDDIQVLVNTLLRTVTRTIAAHKEGKNNLMGSFVACLISLLRQMEEHHYQAYIALYPNEFNLADVLMELLSLFRDLIKRNAYRSDWVSMIQLQNSVLLRTIKFIGTTLNKVFLDDRHFHHEIWNNYFRLGVEYLTQSSLQLENFSQNKRRNINKKYSDLRCLMGAEIRKMWFNLGRHKIQFIPDMIGPILEMTMVPQDNLRKSTIPIFFDMMQCELHSTSNFNQVKNELIIQLDVLVEKGKGDAKYKDLFYEIMMGWCKKHQYLRQSGAEFVSLIRILLDRLFDYRDIIREDNRDNKMICTVNLLNFYKDKNHKMYIRYLHKLCDLHTECDNYTEAAFTLLKHSKELNWSDEPLLDQHGEHRDMQTHRELKVKLYYQIIELFKKGKLWEEGIKLCKELSTQLEQETFQYEQLSELLILQSELYKNIINNLRPDPEYFFVGYYGQGFPQFLKNRMFIHRGSEYERLGDFTSRILMGLPNANKMTTTTKPTDEILSSSGMYVQVYTVNPVMQEPAHFKGKNIGDKILGYYRSNEVQKFEYSRPFRKGKKDPNNEFATMWVQRSTFTTNYKLPGILRWFEITDVQEKEMSPLEIAIETMEQTNKDLKQLVNQYLVSDANVNLNPLSMKLNGIVDARVMGGFANYEKAFFTPEYMKEHPEDDFKIKKLKDLIANQIPPLAKGIEIHGELAPTNLRPLQESMEASFNNLRKKVVENYGERPPYEGNLGRYKAVAPTQRSTKMQPARPESIMSIQSYGSDINLNINEGPPPEIPAKKNNKVVMRSTSMQSTPSKSEIRKSKSDWLSSFGGSSTSLDKDKSSLHGSKTELAAPVELREEITPQRPRRPRSRVETNDNGTANFSTAMDNNTKSPARHAPPLPMKSTGDYGYLPGDADVKMRRPQNNVLRNKPAPPLPIKKQDGGDLNSDNKPNPLKPTRNVYSPGKPS